MLFLPFLEINSQVQKAYLELAESSKSDDYEHKFIIALTLNINPKKLSVTLKWV